MARIQQYHSQISAQTGSPSPMSSPADFGAGMIDGMARALEKVGESVEKSAATIEAKKERDADLWRAQVIAEEQVNWTKALQETQISSEPGAPGIAEKFKQDTSSRMEELLKTAPTELSRQKLQIGLTGIYGDVQAKAVGFQAAAAAKESVGRVQSISKSYENLVYLDPSKYGEVLTQTGSVIDTLTIGYKDPDTGAERKFGLTKQAADDMKKAQQESYASKMFEGRVDRAKTVGEVNGILTEIKGEAWQKVIPAQQYERLISNATQAGEQIAKKNDQIIIKDANERINAAAMGLPVGAPNVSAISDTVVRAQVAKDWGEAQRYGDTYNRVKMASPSELAVMVADLDQRSKGGTISSRVDAAKLRDMAQGRLTAVSSAKVDAYADVAATGTPVDFKAARAAAANIADPVVRAKEEAKLDAAESRGEMVRSVKAMPAEEIPGTIAGLTAKAEDVADPVAQRQAIADRDLLFKVLKQRQDEIKDDSAGYVAQHVPQVRRAYDAWRDAQSKAKQGDEASALKANVAQREYVTETIAAQTRLGIPMGKVNILSKVELAQYRDTIDKTDRTPEGAENAANTLIGVWQQHGKDYGNMVYRQMVEEKVISGVDVVVARMSDQDQKAAGVDLKKAAAIGEKELLKLTNSEEKVKTEVAREVTTAMVPLTQTLAQSVGGVSAATQTAEAARLLAIFNVATRGMTVQDAVKTATNSVAMSKYNFVGSYRVPVRDHDSGAMIDHYAISDSASGILRSADKLDVALPKSVVGLQDPTVRENSIASLKAFGSWATDADEAGLQMRWQNGEAVMRKDGKPLRFSWKELLDSTSFRSDVDALVGGGP